MQKLFISQIKQGSYVVFSKKLSRLMGLTIGDHLYIYKLKDEKGYTLSSTTMDYELVEMTVTEFEQPHFIKVKLPKQLLSDLLCGDTVFAYYLENGTCELKQAEPYCSCCEKITPLQDLHAVGNIMLCPECYNSIEHQLDDVYPEEQQQNFEVNIKDLNQKDSNISENFDDYLFALEQKSQSLRTCLYYLEKFLIKLEKHYTKNEIEILEIFHHSMMKMTAEYFYTLGKKEREKEPYL